MSFPAEAQRRGDQETGYPASASQRLSGSLSYPPEFAATIWIPFVTGSAIWQLIARAESTFADFIADEANHFSETGYRYDALEMKSLWTMICDQKKRVAAFHLVAIGEYPAYQPARDAVEGMTFPAEAQRRGEEATPCTVRTSAPQRLSGSEDLFQTPGIFNQA